MTRRALAKNVAIYGLGALLTRSLGLILIPIYTRFLTVEQYGTLALLNQIFQLFSFIFLMGVSSACMRYYANTTLTAADRGKLYGTGAILLIVGPLVLVVLLAPAAYVLVERWLPSVPFFPYIALVLTSALFTPMIALMAGMLRIQERAINYIAFYVAYFLTQGLLIIVAVALLRKGLSGLFVAQLVSNLAFALVALSIIRPHARLVPDRSTAGLLLSFGVPLIPYFVFTWINTASGRFILERYGTLEDVGLFALAMQFGRLANIVARAFDNALLPRFYRIAGEPGNGERLGSFTIKYIAFFAIVAIGTSLVGEPLILLIAAPAFHAATQHVALIAGATWLEISARPFIWNLMYARRTGLLSYVRSGAAILQVVILIVVLKYLGLGIAGVIYSLIATNVTMLGLAWAIGGRRLPLRLNLRRAGARVLTPTAIAFVTMHMCSSPVWRVDLLAIKAVVAMAVCVILLHGTGLTRDLRDIVGASERGRG